MSNGLDSLEAKRHRGRVIPPSTHKPRQTPVELPEPPPVEDVEGNTEQREVAAATKQPVKKSSEAVEVVARRTIHLAPTDDEFLDSVFMAGRQDPAGKFDASRSAVVRLALARLADEMNPAQVVAELKKRTPKTTSNGGRPRR